MNHTALSVLKTKVLAAAKLQLSQSIDTLQGQLEALEKAQAEESKSSAGDKFETARERLNQEHANLAQNFLRVKQQRTHLQQLAKLTAPTGPTVQEGQLVALANGYTFFIGPALGKIKLAEQTVHLISKASPLGNSLLGKATGASISMGKTQTTVLEFC